MLKQRIITASILSFVFLFALLSFSTPLFISFIMLIVLIAGWEWADLARVKTMAGKFLFLLAMLLSMMIMADYVGLYSQYDLTFSYQVCLGIMVLWSLILLWLQGYPSSAILWSPRPVMLVLGIVLLSATWLSLASIISLENGRFKLVLAITIIVLADIGGYIAGKLFGKHKLAPTISPGKTLEGLLGGMALQLLLIVGLMFYMPKINVQSLCLLVFPVALASVIGDLFESMLKRHRGVKDSSNFLPGHGGFLDRLDGVMAALPMFFVIIINANPF